MNTKKIYIVGNQLNYADFIKYHQLVDNINDADIVIFTGGEDVNPALYNCERDPSTYYSEARDAFEVNQFKQIHNNQLVVSICRGSQLTCVLNGGLLIQNVTGHALGCTHSITEGKTQRRYEITSTHHQMQYPFNLPKDFYNILFYSSINLSSEYRGDKIDFVPCEPEIVLYHKPNLPKCLAIQGHPEYMRSESPIVIRLNEIIDDLLNNKDLYEKD